MARNKYTDIRVRMLIPDHSRMRWYLMDLPNRIYHLITSLDTCPEKGRWHNTNGARYRKGKCLPSYTCKVLWLGEERKSQNLDGGVTQWQRVVLSTGFDSQHDSKKKNTQNWGKDSGSFWFEPNKIGDRVLLTFWG
jgi:hypothetical protein